MKGCSVLLGGFLAIVTSVAFAADPDFKDYTVTPEFTGINHEPVSQEHSNPRMDKDRAQALKRKVNFAGHYILYQFACGGSTLCGEVLDARTGEVVGGLPNAYDGNTFSLSNKPDSRLLIVSGIAADTEEDAQGNELESRYRTRYFEFVNNEFRLLTFKDL
ncbi:hypothetical protein [Pseudomonas sp. IzPS59]|uniref:hypothetical protein n=1 Tax=Pseudomonas sp. IzPS59 TaxID=2774459 RepID=UPI0017889C05|nr:hypothetical protein [Pseudomonas sp. IzPS59]